MMRYLPAALLGVLLATAPSTLYAQASPETVSTLAADLYDAQQAHLWRVGGWGGANLIGGLALWLSTHRADRPARWSFGGMTAGWGAVNLGIAALGGLALDPPATTTAAALSAERTYHDLLLLNLGLNVAYMGVGGTMLAAGYRNVGHAPEWRGAGTALLIQGAGLLALDGVAFIASRSRLGELIQTATGAVSLHIGPSRVALAIGL